MSDHGAADDTSTEREGWVVSMWRVAVLCLLAGVWVTLQFCLGELANIADGPEVRVTCGENTSCEVVP